MNTLLLEDRIEACKSYYNKFHKIPKTRETMMFKGIKFNIGRFITSARQGYYNTEIKHELINIFGSKVLVIGTSKQFSDDEKLQGCIKFYSLYHEVPKQNDTITINDKVFKIGYFIRIVRRNTDSELTREVEKIFGIKLAKTDISIDDKLESCRLFFNQFGRIPYYNEYTNNVCEKFNIGKFVTDVRNKMYSDGILQTVNNIFGPEKQHKRVLKDNEVLELIREYYKLDDLPIVYEGLCMKNIIFNIIDSKAYNSIYSDVLLLKQEYKQRKETRILTTIREYFAKYKCSPKHNLKYKGINIRNVITSILAGNSHKNMKTEVEQLVNMYK